MSEAVVHTVLGSLFVVIAGALYIGVIVCLVRC
jgi:hypothetical protein